MPESDGRQYLPSFAELVDRLTVDQIKEVLAPSRSTSIAEEIKRLENDMNMIINTENVIVSARLLRKVIILAQINLHIWHNKDEMQEDPERYSELLTMAHQLNGIRNRIKNSLLDETGDSTESARHTNTETDGLRGWDISL
ncbi:MAG: hypothetical protein VB824_09800 [Dehalococcoidia bacterium]